MYGYNTGYYGYVRSVRSQEAIDNYEVPLSLINKELIMNYLQDTMGSYTEDDYIFLSKTPIKIWRETTKTMKATSWHHTSSWYNETKHYSLRVIASKMLEMKKADQNNIFKPRPKPKKAPERYGFLVSQVWGGTRNYPKIVGSDKIYGQAKGEWLTCAKTNRRFKITANKTIRYVETKTLEEARIAMENDG